MNDFQAENIQTKWLFPDLLFHFILCKLFSFAIDTENYSEDGFFFFKSLSPSKMLLRQQFSIYDTSCMRSRSATVVVHIMSCNDVVDAINNLIKKSKEN